MARDRTKARLARKERKFLEATEAHLETIEEIVAGVASLAMADDPRLEHEPTLDERLLIAAWQGFWLGRTGQTFSEVAGDSSALDTLRGERQDA